MHINLKKYKKVSQDKDTSTFEHPEGHQMIVSHRSLSPKLRKEILALPYEKKDNKPQQNPKLEESKKTPKFAEGGYVDTTTSGDPIVKAVKGKAPEGPAREGSDWSSKPIQSPKDPVEEDYKRQAAAFNAKTAPVSNTQRFAEGGETVQDVDYQKLPDQAPTQEPTSQAPVTINIGQPAPAAAQPEMPMAQGAGHYVGDLLRTGVSDTVGAFKNVAAPVSDAVQGVVQGAAGQPLAPIPTLDQGASPASVPEAPISAPVAANGNLATLPQAPTASNPFQSALQEQIKGLELGEKAQETAAQGKEAALGDYNRAQEEAASTYDAHVKDAMALREDALKSLQEGKIDSNRYWNNKSTGGKVGTILGIIAAGFNPTHNPNAAIEMLNREIDRDIDSQKADLGRKQNLLSAANDHFKNIQSAADFHRVMTNDLVSHKIDEALAKAATPQAQAELMKARGALKFDSEMRMAQIGAMQTLNGQASPDDQAKALNTLRLVAPEKAKEYESRIIPGVGTATVPVPEKKREAFAAAHTFIQQMDALEKFRQEHHGTMLDRGVVDEGHRLAELARNSFRIAQGEGVFKEGSAKFNERLIPDPTDVDWFKKNKPAYQAMKDQAGSEVKSSMQVYGIKPQASSIFSQGANLSPQEKSFYDWAKQTLASDPKNAKALMVLKKLGINN